MSPEMRAFVSLIVWLFFIRGADGEITAKPDNFIIVKGTTATLRCVSTKENSIKWSYQSYMKPDEDDAIDAIDNECKAQKEFIDAKLESPTECNLIAKDTLESMTFLYSCDDGDGSGRGIVMMIDSPLKCGIEGNKYSCTMANSAYINGSAITSKPYISSRLVWKDDKGNEVASTDSDTQSPGTVVTTDIPAGNLNPYVCSAEFKMVGDIDPKYSATITIVPDGKLECKYPETTEQEQAAQGSAEEQTEAPAEAAKQAGGNKTSNANLERDGVDAIAMMLSLMAAFLVY